MQALLICKQEDNESNKDFLQRLISWAEKAGLTECTECLNRDIIIVNRFIHGTNDLGLKAKIMGMSNAPSILQIRQWCDVKGFDMLFGNNLIHVLESIFISLDYESFKKCLDVCQTWRELLMSPSLQRLVKAKFYVDMWMDVERLERRVCMPERKILNWTTNGEEVAFIEHFDGKFWLHHININGDVKCVHLKIRECFNQYLKHESRRHSRKMWILKNAIIIDLPPTEYEMGHVCAVYKDSMKESVLVSRPMDPGSIEWMSSFSDKYGIFFVTSVKSNDIGNAEAEVLWVHKISADHSAEDEWESDADGNCVLHEMGCCKSKKINYVCNFQPHAIFNTDSTRLIFWDGRDVYLVAYALDKEEFPVEWRGRIGVNMPPLEMMANSRLLVIWQWQNFEEQLVVKNLMDFTTVATFKGLSMDSWPILITEKYLIMDNYYGYGLPFGLEGRYDVLPLDDLSSESSFIVSQFSEEHSLEIHATFLRHEKIIPFFILHPDDNTYDIIGISLVFKSFDREGPGKEAVLFDGRPRSNTKRGNHMLIGNFREVIEGVCIFDQPTRKGLTCLLTASWSSQKLPKALKVFFKVIEHPRGCIFCDHESTTRPQCLAGGSSQGTRDWHGPIDGPQCQPWIRRFRSWEKHTDE